MYSSFPPIPYLRVKDINYYKSLRSALAACLYSSECFCIVESLDTSRSNSPEDTSLLKTKEKNRSDMRRLTLVVEYLFMVILIRFREGRTVVVTLLFPLLNGPSTTQMKSFKLSSLSFSSNYYAT